MFLQGKWAGGHNLPISRWHRGQQAWALCWAQTMEGTGASPQPTCPPKRPRDMGGSCATAGQRNGNWGELRRAGPVLTPAPPWGPPTPPVPPSDGSKSPTEASLRERPADSSTFALPWHHPARTRYPGSHNTVMKGRPPTAAGPKGTSGPPCRDPVALEGGQRQQRWSQAPSGRMLSRHVAPEACAGAGARRGAAASWPPPARAGWLSAGPWLRSHRGGQVKPWCVQRGRGWLQPALQKHRAALGSCLWLRVHVPVVPLPAVPEMCARAQPGHPHPVGSRRGPTSPEPSPLTSHPRRQQLAAWISPISPPRPS